MPDPRNYFEEMKIKTKISKYMKCCKNSFERVIDLAFCIKVALYQREMLSVLLGLTCSSRIVSSWDHLVVNGRISFFLMAE